MEVVSDLMIYNQNQQYSWDFVEAESKKGQSGKTDFTNTSNIFSNIVMYY